MDNYELVSHVAAGTQVTRADAAEPPGRRRVLRHRRRAGARGARDYPGLREFRPHAAAQPEPAAIPGPVSPSPSRPRGRRRSSPRRPFATRSTNGRVKSTPEPAIHPATSAAAARRAGSDSRTAGPGTLVAGTRRGYFVDLVNHANTCAATRGARIPSRAGALYGRMPICSFDNGAHVRAPVETGTYPSRLRHRSHHDPTTRTTMANPWYRARLLAAFSLVIQARSFRIGQGQRSGTSPASASQLPITTIIGLRYAAGCIPRIRRHVLVTRLFDWAPSLAIASAACLRVAKTAPLRNCTLMVRNHV